MKVEVGRKYIGKNTNIKVVVREINKITRRVTYQGVNIPRTRHTVSFIDFMTKFRPE